jgi:hypothetical protein
MSITKTKIALAIVFTVLALLSLVALYKGLQYRQLVTENATAPGVVTKLDRRWNRPAWFTEHYRYLAQYEFRDPAGRLRRDRQRITHAQYDEWNADDADRNVEVHFRRSNPAISAISLDDLRSEVRTSVLLGLLTAALLAAGLLVEHLQGKRRGTRGEVERIDAYYARKRGTTGKQTDDGDGKA